MTKKMLALVLTAILALTLSACNPYSNCNTCNSATSQARAMADVIPFGQPILVGHHSEGRDRNYRARINSKFRKGYELRQRAEELKSRAEAAANNDAIYSDDPSAVNKLESKLDDLLALQAKYKAINAAHAKFLKNPASLDACDLTEGEKKFVREWQPAYRFEKHPIQPYQLTNLSARIRTAQKRAEDVEKQQAIPDKDEEINGIRVEWRASENRIRVFYPSRVPRETFETLRRHGYRVLRSEGEGAFSAYYNRNAAEYIRQLREDAKK